MVHAVLLVADVSKVPFFVAGGALALWAVILGTIGLRNPDFPGGAGGQRGVIGITLVLAVVAMAAAVYIK